MVASLWRPRKCPAPRPSPCPENSNSSTLLQLEKVGLCHTRVFTADLRHPGRVADLASSLSPPIFPLFPQALAFVYDPEIVKSLFEQAPQRYSDRAGGYCRVVTEIQPRRGDNSIMATIELV